MQTRQNAAARETLTTEKMKIPIMGRFGERDCVRSAGRTLRLVPRVQDTAALPFNQQNSPLPGPLDTFWHTGEIQRQKEWL
jgi:hypothetical protein